ncbi:3425_t:CDS:1, partial [Diversispora eburnea]
MPEIDKLEMDKFEMNGFEMYEFKISEHESEINLLLDDQQLIQDIEEYTCLINQPAKTEDVLTDEGIIEMVIHKFHNSDDKLDDKERSPPSFSITIIEAIDALKK